MSKDEWIQEAKALMFDCTFCLDSKKISEECKELINLGGGYNYEVESSKTALIWREVE